MTDHDDATRALTEALRQHHRDLIAEPESFDSHKAVAVNLVAELRESGHGIAPLSVIEAGEALERLRDCGTDATIEHWPSARDLPWAVDVDGRHVDAATLPEAVRAALEADR